MRDDQGNEYLDFLTGISVAQLGHCHPAVVQAVCEQAGRLMHVGNLFYTEPGMRLAKRLSDSSLGGKVFLCNSGAEANEAAFKLSRRTGRETAVIANTERPVPLTFTWAMTPLTTRVVMAVIALGIFIAGLFVCAGALRLARFNVPPGVTKGIDEAILLSDRVVVMSNPPHPSLTEKLMFDGWLSTPMRSSRRWGWSGTTSAATPG